MVNTEDWRAAYSDVVARGRERAGDPPTPEELVAWFRGELPESEAERIRELLALYPDLAEALLDDDDGDEPPVLTRDELATDWKRLQARMNAPATLPAPPPLTYRPAAFQWHWATAASLLLTFAFAGLFVHSRSTARALRAQLNEPRQNVEHVILLESTSRGPAGAIPVQLQPATQYVVFTFTVDEDRQQDRLTAVMRDLDDPTRRIVWRGTVARGGDRTYSLEVPRSFLAAQTYEVTLHDQQPRPVATYTLWLSR
ncbi:MAG: hypothetical protein M3Q69_00065 [Acidobacteriota bacterium]|nr:hypothetical protein [Acidobacteriota bacterium]